jgi:VIT1/CCC1 family predicted Fe2+/Mn2+ transporter
MNATYTDILARRARQVQRGGARAAVLGVNDGLVSTLCIVLAVAAAGADAKAVLLAGFAGLIAGAVSMAAGEWISVKAQVELFDGILSDIHKLVGKHKGFLVGQLAEGLMATGHEKPTAQAAAKEIAKNEKQLGDAYARQVMGFNPEELGSPWLAAASSFVLFTVGALVPLAPWLFGSGMVAVMLSIILTAIAGLIVGGYIANSSGKSIIVGALRQLGIILLASAVTYGVGYLFGVTVG